ncbi:MAG TPA: MBL fold metallo-hydrolase [Candidatus Polarisedimenticolia bacterium]|jgi:glyoxylase-like metal-dependent hydrolase (beta-lactamase superfamily II)|nr:MBL fold metallo-hydrolase [Candidatus Polarisedimenticolia bacterium]
MSEPKTVAVAITEVVPGLFHYRIDDERIKSQSDAYAVARGGRVVLIDPLPLEPSLLQGLGRIEAIVLGAPGHQRSSWSLRRRHGATVHAPEGASGLEEKPDASYKEGDFLPGGLKPIQAPGPKGAHYAFHVEAKPGLLLCTDLWHMTPRGVEFLPDKYLSDPARARATARRLLGLDFDIVCFGHGDPILRGARHVLAGIVEADAAARKT